MTSLDLFRLEGRIAIISGGAGIVGRHIVRALAEAGAVTIVASRSTDSCEALANELRGEGLQAEGEQCDFAAEHEITALRERVLSRHGGLDILVNNAVA